MSITRKLDRNLVASGNGVTNVKSLQSTVLDESFKKKQNDQIRKGASSPSSQSTLDQAPLASVQRYRFPDDLSIYYMGFSFENYTRANFTVPPRKQITTDIALPIPQNLTDSLEERWDEQEIGLLGHAIDAASNAAEKITGAAQARDYAAFATAAAGGAAAALYDLGPVASTIRGGLNQALKSQGQSFNPYLAIFFNGPRFKKHRFNWRFSPKNAKESETIRDIIRSFHYAMSPDLTYNNILFSYPTIVVPKLFNGPDQNDFLYDFKPCVIENVVVNYAPNGIPSFFKGTKAPTEIEFQLALSEINLWLKEDYAGASNGGS